MLATALRSAVRPAQLGRVIKPVVGLRATPMRFLSSLAAQSGALAAEIAGEAEGDGARFTTDHEWVSYDKDTNIGTVGITDYAQKALGDVVFVELPAAGTEIAQGDSIGAVESVKAASDIYAPVAGVVESINEDLNDQPGLLNKDPEAKGWLCKITLSEPAEFDTLLTAEAYKAHCDGSD